MFSTSEQFTQAGWQLCEAQAIALTRIANAALDAGLDVLGRNVDTVKTVLASGTVALRQVTMSAGHGNDWLAPIPNFHHIGQLALAALPLGASYHAEPDAGPAPAVSLE